LNPNSYKINTENRNFIHDSMDMTYSREMIFKNSGQYDAFVELTFYPESEAFKKLGRVLLGTFKYTRQERTEMQKRIENDEVEHSDGYIKFEPSDVPKELSPELKEYLDRIGILNIDIHIISSLNFRRTNRYTTEGDREILNKMVIEFDPGDLSGDQMKLGNFRMRLKGGYPLVADEWRQYIGLELFHGKALSPQVTEKMDNTEEGKKITQYYYLSTKIIHSNLTVDELKEYEKLRSDRIDATWEILKSELQKSTEKLKELASHYKDNLQRILVIAITFDTEVILPYKFPIWWNLERFLHIYMRHVRQTNIGERFNGSLFRYKFQDVRRVISAVVKKSYAEIEDHFQNGNLQNFLRAGRRAVYHDGVYYRLEIEPSGLLRTFHPEENREE
jgi:hypothetical protein